MLNFHSIVVLIYRTDVSLHVHVHVYEHDMELLILS